MSVDVTLRLTADERDLVGGLRVSRKELDKARGDFGSVRESARRSGRGMREFGTEAQRAGRRTQSLGRELTTVRNLLVGSAGVYFGVQGVKRIVGDTIGTFTEFETSVSNLSAITGATGDDLGYLRDQALDMGKTTSQSATQAVTAIKLMASAKPDLLESGQALAGVTREALTLAEAASIDLPQATSVLGGALNQFKAEAEDANRFINVLAAGAKLGSSEIAQTADALRDSGTVAAAAKVPFEELNAAIQVLAKVTITGARAGTGLRNVLTIMQTGADELNPAVVGMTQALRNYQKEQLSTTELVEIFGRENFVVAQELINNADALGELTEKLTGTQTATEQASKNLDNLEGDTLKLQSAWEALQITITQGSDAGLREMTQSLTEVLRLLEENGEEIGETIVFALSAVDDIAKVLTVTIGGRLVASVTAFTAETVKNTAASITNARAMARKAEFARAAAVAELQMARQITAATGSMEAQRLAAIRLQGAHRAYTAAVAHASVANRTMAATSKAAGAAMGLVGGPVGVLVVGLWGLHEVLQADQRRLEALSDIAPETAQSFEEAMTSFSAGAEDAKRKVGSALDDIRSDIRDARDELAQIEAERAATPDHLRGLVTPTDLFGNDLETGPVTDQLDNLTGKAREAEAAMAVLEGTDVFSVLAGKAAPAIEAFNDFFEASEDAGDGAQKFGEDVQDALDDLDKFTAKQRDSIASLEAEIATFGKGEAAMIRYRAEQVAVAAESQAAEAASDAAREAFLEQARTIRDNADELAARTKQLNAMEAAEREAKEAAELITSTYFDLLERFDEAAAVTLKYEKRLQALNDKVGDETENQEMLAAAIEMTKQARDEDLRAIADRLSAGEKIIEDLEKEITLTRLSGIEREAAAATWDLSREEFEKHHGRIMQLLEERAIVEAAKSQAREYEGHWSNAVDSVSRAMGDWITGGIESFKDFGNALKDIARQLISDLVSIFVRNRIVIPIAMAMMGGTANAGGMDPMSMAMSAAGGGGGGGGVLGALSGAAGGFGAGLGSFATNVSNLGLFKGGAASLTQGLGNIGGFFTGGSSASGLMAGIAQAVAPIAIAAFAAKAIDSLSGGRLFGTSYETDSRAQAFSFGAGGATGQMEIEQSRERSLFRGTKRRTLIEDLDPDTQAAIEQFFNQLTDAVASASEQLGVEIPSIVEGSFRQVLDDQGNVESSTANVAGREYTDLSMEEFQKLLTAENLIAVAAQANEAADAIAERWRGSVDQLMEGAQLLLAVQKDIQEGNALLEGDNPLKRTVDLVEELQGRSETLAQSYQRLSVSTAMFEEALDLMGSAWEGSREDLVRHATAITDAAGGLERATNLWQRYFNAFYSDVERLESQRGRVRSSAADELGDVGLDIDVSRSAFRSAFEAAMGDPDLAADAKAEWLEAAAALADVLDLEAQLADARRQQADLMRDVNDAVAEATGTLSPLDAALRDVNRQTDDWVRRARDLGMSEEELADIRAAGQVLVREAIADFREQQQDFLTGIQDEIDQLTLTPFQNTMKDIARSFDETMERGRELGLSTEQLAGVQELAARRMDEAVAALENRARDLVGQLYGTPLERVNEQIADIQNTFMTGAESSQIVGRHLLEPLLEERARLERQKEAAERIDLAQQLAGAVADIAGVRGTDDFRSLAEEFGFNLGDLAEDLGIDQSALDDYLRDLQATSYTLDDLTGGMDQVITSQVDRLIDAIYDSMGRAPDGRVTNPDAGGAGTKPINIEGGGKQQTTTVATPPTQVVEGPVIVDRTEPSTRRTSNEGMAPAIEALVGEIRLMTQRTEHGTILRPESTAEMERLLAQLLEEIRRQREDAPRSDRGKAFS